MSGHLFKQDSAIGLVPLNNDHHFWGVVSTGVEKGPISDKLIEIGQRR